MNANMMVETGYILKKVNELYEVIIADDHVFVTGKMDNGIVNYTNSDIYSNDKTILSLKELGFEIVRPVGQKTEYSTNSSGFIKYYCCTAPSAPCDGTIKAI